MAFRNKDLRAWQRRELNAANKYREPGDLHNWGDHNQLALINAAHRASNRKYRAEFNRRALPQGVAAR